MKFLIKTLGCKVNWLDSARIATALESVGHQQVMNDDEAEMVFINSCTVTAEADRKSHQFANKTLNLQKDVIVTGCSTRVDGGSWSARSDDSIMVLQDELAIFNRFDIDPDEVPFPVTSRTRLPISIQTGCDNECSFCITRLARGKHQNIPEKQVIDQIKHAIDEGVREVVLTGINLAAWGSENSNNASSSHLHRLLEAILSKTTIERIRFSSLGPQYIQQPFFDLFADSRVCDYLHVSMQSGSNSVLDRMVRGHGTEEIAKIAEMARKVRPNTAVAADIIAGFPGETDSEHQETVDFIQQIGFSKLHVFPYSEREGTPAADHSDPIERKLRKERAKEIREIALNLRKTYIQEQMGRNFSILAEEGGHGLTSNYIRVRCDGAKQGEITTVTLNEETLAEKI
ncbi:MAG: MiaB/RimO family radical SAM methylthiotransferase [Chromatiales bacterium]|nr:MiaB/RimO family radical SAM methylthiotransferase [Chromatiales bacterium]